MLSMNVKGKMYKANNEIFRAHKWVDTCTAKGQRLAFVGVKMHHQNWYAKRRIRELQGTARTLLVHAMKR